MKRQPIGVRLLLVGLIVAGLVFETGIGRGKAAGEHGQGTVIVAPTSGLITQEGGGTASFTIRLGSRPSAAVHIPLSSSNPAEGTVSVTEVTIGPGAWNVPVTVIVTGVDDGEVDGDVVYRIIVGFTDSNDHDYDGINPDNVWVTNQDNDVPGPVANDDSEITAEDTPVTTPVLSNDTGLEAGPITVQVVNTPNNGTAQVQADLQVVYTPAANFNGNDSYTYQVCDANSACDTADVLVTVSPVNDPPQAVDDIAAVQEDLDLSIDVLANDSDPDGDGLILTAVGAPQYGMTMIINNQVMYLPLANFNGVDHFSYTVSDGNGGTDQGNVTVNISLSNDPPVAVDDNLQTTQDTPVNVAVLNNDSDPDGDPVLLESFEAVSAKGGSLQRDTRGTPGDKSDDQLVYTPAGGFTGSDTFNYTISDGTLVDSAQVSVNVVAGTAPVANPDTYNVVQDGILNVSAANGVLSNDATPGGGNLAAQLVSGPAHGTLQLNADGSFTYSPTAGFSGQDGFQYQALSGAQSSAAAQVTLHVQAGNAAPLAGDDAYTVESSSLVVAAPGVLLNDSDPNGQTLTAALVSGPQHGTLDLNPDGSFTYQPQTGFVGTDTFTYRAQDGETQSAPATVRLTIPDAEPPQVTWLAPVPAEERLNVGAEMVQLEVQVSDNVGVQRVHFFRWDAHIQQFVDIANLTQPPYQVQIDATLLNPQWNQVFVRAYDAAGNASERQFIWLYQTGATQFRVYAAIVQR